MTLGTISVGGITTHTISRLEVAKDLTGRNAVAKVTVFGVPSLSENSLYGAALTKYGTAIYSDSGSVPTIDAPAQLDEVIIEDSGSNRVFAGYVVSIEQERVGRAGIDFVLSCIDYNLLLETTVVTAAATFTNATDRAILQSLFTTYLPEITTLDANLEIIQSVVPFFDATDLSLSEAIKRLAELVEAEYRVDENKALHWFTPENNVATKQLSDEPHGENFFLFSEQADNSYWTKTGITVDDDATISPGGFATADKLEETTATSDHKNQLVLSPSTPIANPAVSIFVKPSERTRFWLGWSDSPTVDRVFFQLVAGSPTVTSVVGDCIGSVEELESGWFRCSAVGGTSTDALIVEYGMTLAEGVTSYTGVTGEGLYVWGSQFERDNPQGVGFYGKTEGTAIIHSASYVMAQAATRFEKPVNRVTVRGALDDEGDEIVVTVSDDDSIAAYAAVNNGVFHRTIVDRTIKSTAVATLRGQILLAMSANPEANATVSTTEDGFDIGQLVKLTNGPRLISQRPYVIRKLTQLNITPDTTEYTLELGPPVRDIVRLLQRLTRISVPDPAFPEAIPPDNSITEDQLREGAVTRLKIAAQAVDTAQIEIGAIVESVIAAAAITETLIAPDAVTSPKILAGAVIAGKIAAGAVIAGTIAASVITGVEIIAGSITAQDAVFAVGTILEADIGIAQITRAKIATLAVDTARIENATITAAKIALATITNAQIANATITNAQIALATIQNSNIENATITGAKIALATITSANIANATITNAKIANATIQNSKIEDATITAAKIALATITTALIQNAAITTALIANAAITDAKIQSLSAGKITAGTITATISIESPHITSVSGSNSIDLNNGVLTIAGIGGIMTLSNGLFESAVNGSGDSTVISGGFFQVNGPTGVKAVDCHGFGFVGQQGNAGAFQVSKSNGAVAVQISTDSSNKGFVKINNGFAVAAGTTNVKIISGFSNFSSGSRTINSGLSSITSANANQINNTTATEYISTSTAAGGNVTFFSSNGSASGFFYYTIIGKE